MPKDVGNYVGITTEGGGAGVFNVFDQIKFKRKNKWPLIPIIKATGGEIVTNESETRVWHVFTLAGVDPSSPAPFSFETTTPSPFTAEILVVGGGGSGGDSLGGGGGAGGIVHASGVTLPGSDTYAMKGMISNIRIFNKTLNATEVSTLYGKKK